MPKPAASKKQARKGQKTPKQSPSSTSTVTAPIARGRVVSNRGPTTRSSQNGIIITHSEMFSTIWADQEHLVHPGGTAMDIYAWTIQPGWNSMFPWLSSIAMRWEKYVMHSIEFEYVPAVSTIVAGRLTMAVDQDPNDSLPSIDDEGRAVLMAHQGAITTPVWSGIRMRYPPGLLPKDERYVRAPGELTTVEPRTADLGTFFVGVFGVPPGDTLGDLIVHYTIGLRLPQLVQPPQASNTSFTLQPSAITANFDPTYPFDEIGGGTSTLIGTGDLANALERVLIRIDGSNHYGLRNKSGKTIVGRPGYESYALRPSGVTPADFFETLVGSLHSYIQKEGSPDADSETGRTALNFASTASFPSSGGSHLDGYADRFVLKPMETFLPIFSSIAATLLSRQTFSLFNALPITNFGLEHLPLRRSVMARPRATIPVITPPAPQASTSGQMAATPVGGKKLVSRT